MKNLSIIGNLGADATAKKNANDTYTINFNVAVSEKYKDANGVEVSNTDWISVFLRRKNAGKIMDYLKKGNQIYVTGKPNFVLSEYNGEKRMSINISNADISLLGTK